MLTLQKIAKDGVTSHLAPLYRSMKKITTCLLCSFLITFASCQAGSTYSPTVRIATALASEYSSSIDVLGYGSASGTYSDSSETMIAIGAKESRGGQVVSLGEFVFSNPSFGLDESSRFAGGGRYYLAQGAAMPFVSIYSVMDSLKSGGVDFGSQLGLSMGLGAEMGFANNAFVDASLNFLIPLTEAEAYNLGLYTYTQLDGWSLNLGAGMSF